MPSGGRLVNCLCISSFLSHRFAGSELVEVYTLSSMKTLQAAVNAIIEFVGMQPAERSNEVRLQ